MKIRCLLIFLGILGFRTDLAIGFQWDVQDDRYLISNLSVDDGLPTKTVTDLTFGKDGYLYLASVNGLVRMDGVHTEVFDAGIATGLNSDRISRIFSLTDSSLVVLDHEGTLYRFRNGIFTSILNPSDQQPINTQVIKHFDEYSLLTADTKNVTIIYPDRVSVLAPSISSYEIWDVEYASGTVYLLNTNGFYAYTGGRYDQIPIPANYAPDLNRHSSLKTIDGHLKIKGWGKSPCYDSNNKKWCNLHSFEIEDENEEILQINSSDQTDEEYSIVTDQQMLLQRSDGSIQNDLDKAGIRYENRFRTSLGNIIVHRFGVHIDNKPVFESDSPIVDATPDNAGNIWISTKHNGVYKISQNKFTNYYSDFLINSYAVIKDERATFWAGSFENGLMNWDGKMATYYTNENSSILSTSVRMVQELRSGDILVSTWGQVPFIVDGKTIEPLDDFRRLFGSSTNVTESFYEEQNGTWWLGTLSGLMRKEGPDYERFFDNEGKSIKHVTRIIPSPYNNDLFFATVDNGVVLLRNNKFYFLSESLPASSKHIRDIYIQSKDTLWAASYDSGLQRFVVTGNSTDPEFKVFELSEDLGLKKAGYHRIIADSLGMLWISSNSGLLRVSEKGLNQSAEAGRIYTNLEWFTERHGIVDREFNGGSQSTGFFDLEEDKIWFTNISGLVSFNPYTFSAEKISPDNFSIQKVISNDSTYITEQKKGLKLEKKERNVTIRYAHIAPSENLTEHIWIRNSADDQWFKSEKVGELILNDLSTGSNLIQFSNAPDGEIIGSISLFVEARLFEHAGVQFFGIVFLAGSILFVISYLRNNREVLPTENSAELEKEIKDEKPKDILADYIHQNYTQEDLSITKISKELSISRSALYRLWKEHHEESITIYINELRLQKATELLESGDFTITEIAEKLGYSSQSYFTKVFKKKYGTSPSGYIKEEVETDFL
jgi:AraC-like DNA-binding protein